MWHANGNQRTASYDAEPIVCRSLNAVHAKLARIASISAIPLTDRTVLSRREPDGSYGAFISAIIGSATQVSQAMRVCLPFWRLHAKFQLSPIKNSNQQQAHMAYRLLVALLLAATSTAYAEAQQAVFLVSTYHNEAPWKSMAVLNTIPAENGAVAEQGIRIGTAKCLNGGLTSQQAFHGVTAKIIPLSLDASGNVLAHVSVHASFVRDVRKVANGGCDELVADLDEADFDRDITLASGATATLASGPFRVEIGPYKLQAAP